MTMISADLPLSRLPRALGQIADAGGDDGGAAEGVVVVALDAQLDHKLQLGRDHVMADDRDCRRRCRRRWSRRRRPRGRGRRSAGGWRYRPAWRSAIFHSGMSYWRARSGCACMTEWGEGGDDGDVFVKQELNGVGAHGAAVLDDVDAEFGDALYYRVEGGVGGDGQAVAMGLVNDGAQFGVGEFDGVVAGHDLDEVGAVFDLIAHGPAHLVRSAGFAAAPVGMAAGLHDGFAGDEQAGDRGRCLARPPAWRIYCSGSCPGRARG